MTDYDKEFRKHRYECNKEKLKKDRKIYYEKNKTKIIIQTTEYHKNNKEHLSKIQIERYKKSVTRINDFKRKSKCEICGFDGSIGDNWAAIVFHHRDSKTKIKPVSAMKTYKWETIKKEIDKCMIICSNCHKIIHKSKY